MTLSLRQAHRKKRKIKKGKHLLSHRYNPLPLLRSHPGGVQEELVVKDLPRHKDKQKVDMGEKKYKVKGKRLKVKGFY